MFEDDIEDDIELRADRLATELEKVQYERDSLEVKVWELERMLNEQENVNKQLRNRIKELGVSS